MATFEITIQAEINEHDQDLMPLVPDHIMSRFDGTALRITRITVEKR